MYQSRAAATLPEADGGVAARPPRRSASACMQRHTAGVRIIIRTQEGRSWVAHGVAEVCGRRCAVELCAFKAVSMPVELSDVNMVATAVAANVKPNVSLPADPFGTNLRAALIFTGHVRGSCARGGGKGLDVLLRHLHNCRAAFEICDVFIHTWDTLDRPPKRPPRSGPNGTICIPARRGGGCQRNPSFWSLWAAEAPTKSSLPCVAQLANVLNPVAITVERQDRAPGLASDVRMWNSAETLKSFRMNSASMIGGGELVRRHAASMARTYHAAVRMRADVGSPNVDNRGDFRAHSRATLRAPIPGVVSMLCAQLKTAALCQCCGRCPVPHQPLVALHTRARARGVLRPASVGRLVARRADELRAPAAQAHRLLLLVGAGRAAARHALRDAHRAVGRPAPRAALQVVPQQHLCPSVLLPRRIWHTAEPQPMHRSRRIPCTVHH